MMSKSFLVRTDFLQLNGYEEAEALANLTSLKNESLMNGTPTAWYLGVVSINKLEFSRGRLIAFEQWIYHMTGDSRYQVVVAEASRKTKIWMMFAIYMPKALEPLP